MQKSKVWQLIMLDENPAEIDDLLKKKNDKKFKNRCLELAKLWKTTTSNKLELNVNEWCIVLGALIEILNRTDEFETYDKSGFKMYRSFSSTIKALDKNKNRTTRAEATLRIYLDKRQLQIYTNDELSRKRDSLIRDLYILENQVLSYNSFDMILYVNRTAFLETELYSVSDNAKNLIRNVAELALAVALMKRNKKISEAVKYQIACCNALVNQLFWGFYYESIRYEVVDYEETCTENLKIFSYYYEILRKNGDLNPLKEFIELNKEIIPYNSTSSLLYRDVIIESFADEICKENVNENEILNFTHPFMYSDGSSLKAEIHFFVNKKRVS